MSMTQNDLDELKKMAFEFEGLSEDEKLEKMKSLMFSASVETKTSSIRGVDPIKYAEAGREMRDFQKKYFAESRKGTWTAQEKQSAIIKAKALEAKFDEMTNQILGLNKPSYVQNEMFK